MATNNNTLFPLGYRPLNITIETITPEMAREMLGYNQNNRTQKKKVIAAYVRDLTAGDWLVTGDPIRFDWNGLLIDGQHRLEACVASGTPITTVVIRNLDPRVKMVIDAGAKRSATDALKWAGVSVQAKDIAATIRVAVAYETGLLATALDNLSRTQLTNSEVVEWNNSNPDVAPAVAFAGRIARRLGSTTPGVATAALILFRDNEAEPVINFFESTAEMRTNGTGDPRKALIDAFAKIRNKEHRAPSAAESLAFIFRAWNAYQEGRPLRILRSTAGDGKGGLTGVSIPTPVRAQAVGA